MKMARIASLIAPDREKQRGSILDIVDHHKDERVKVPGPWQELRSCVSIV